MTNETLMCSSNMIKSAFFPLAIEPVWGLMPRSLAGVKLAILTTSYKGAEVKLRNVRTSRSLVATLPAKEQRSGNLDNM